MTFLAAAERGVILSTGVFADPIGTEARVGGFDLGLSRS